MEVGRRKREAIIQKNSAASTITPISTIGIAAVSATMKRESKKQIKTNRIKRLTAKSGLACLRMLKHKLSQSSEGESRAFAGWARSSAWIERPPPKGKVPRSKNLSLRKKASPKKVAEIAAGPLFAISRKGLKARVAQSIRNTIH